MSHVQKILAMELDRWRPQTRGVSTGQVYHDDLRSSSALAVFGKLLIPSNTMWPCGGV